MRLIIAVKINYAGIRRQSVVVITPDIALEAKNLTGKEIVNENVLLLAKPFHIVLAMPVSVNMMLAFGYQSHPIT
jgi:hypothetical protein